jgi:hypothetical protein
MRLLLALTLVACTGAPADSPLPTDITLKTGDQRAIRGLTVTFVGVKEDSRCPTTLAASGLATRSWSFGSRAAQTLSP